MFRFFEIKWIHFIKNSSIATDSMEVLGWTSFCHGFKIMSGKKSSDLIKDCVRVFHGSDLLVFVSFFAHSL
jgi:hypothetical protein